MARRSFEHSTPGRAGVIDMKTGEQAEVKQLPVICASVRHYRMLLGLEQKQLAALVGVTKNAVGNWESGRSRPDINLIPALCRVFGVSPARLLGLEEPAPAYSAEEQTLVADFRSLSPGHRYAVKSMLGALREVERAERRRPRLFPLPYYEKPLAAGIGDPTEYEGRSRTLYLYDAPELRRADCVYSVNGDSMEPAFRDGDLVFVERIPDASPLQLGEIGAFIVGNELYIKQYEREGLRSLNEKYPLMRFDGGDTSVYLLGRVLGAVSPALLASEADIADYQINGAGE